MSIFSDLMLRSIGERRLLRGPCPQTLSWSFLGCFTSDLVGQDYSWSLGSLSTDVLMEEEAELGLQASGKQAVGGASHGGGAFTPLVPTSQLQLLTGLCQSCSRSHVRLPVLGRVSSPPRSLKVAVKPRGLELSWAS